MESYARKAAKSVLAQWLREEASVVGSDGYVDFRGLSWRVNRGGPHWGVWEEYPVLWDRTGIDPVWDEVFWREPRLPPGLGEYRPPTYRELKRLDMQPEAILDIAIQHKGIIRAAIEVVHKHPPTEGKIAFLDSCGLSQLLVVPTQWVLGQIDKPKHIPPEFWRIGRSWLEAA